MRAALSLTGQLIGPEPQEIRATRLLPGITTAQLVTGAEVLVNLDIDLLPVGVDIRAGLQTDRANSLICIVAAQIPISCGVEAVARREIVSCRCELQVSPDNARGIKPRAEGVPHDLRTAQRGT